MGEEDRGKELPHRVRGAARAGPPPSASSLSPALSEELRRRLHAAVEAERAEAVAQERTTELPRRGTASRPTGGDITTPPVEQTNGHSKQSAKPESAVRSGRVAKPESTTQAQPATKAESLAPPEPAAEGDELTEWLKPAVRLQPDSRRPSAPVRTGRLAPSYPRGLKRPRRRRVRARLVTLVLVGIVIGSLTVTVAIHYVRSPGGSGAANPALLRQEAADRKQAAAWVAQQVSPDVTVACDEATSVALKADGFPGRLLVLGPTSPDPMTSAVVVVTATVRSLFGSSLTTARAPAVLASFGSGTAETSVRVIAPHGVLAYHAALSADLADRKASGADVLRANDITISPSARTKLMAGQVDSRLVLAIASLAADHPIDIVQFGNIGPGGDPDIPLRFADLAENDQAAHLASSAYVQALRASLNKLGPSLRPARTQVVVFQTGQSVFRFEYTAPSPLGLFSG